MKFRFSQAELASQLNVSQSTIWEWERADSNIKLEHVIRLCEVFGMKISELSDDGMLNGLNKVASLPDSMYTSEKEIPENKLYDELIQSLKSQISLLESEVKRLKKEAGAAI